MLDNNFYIKKTIKIFLIFATVVAVISLGFMIVNNIVNPKQQVEQPKIDNSIKAENKSTDHRHSKIDEKSIKNDLTYQEDLKINSIEEVNKWNIVTVSPKNKELEPALLIYKKTGDLYERVVGPGTSFTKEYLRFVGVPDEIMSNNTVKGYLSE